MCEPFRIIILWPNTDMFDESFKSFSFCLKSWHTMQSFNFVLPCQIYSSPSQRRKPVEEVPSNQLQQSPELPLPANVDQPIRLSEGFSWALARYRASVPVMEFLWKPVKFRQNMATSTLIQGDMAVVKPKNEIVIINDTNVVFPNKFILFFEVNFYESCLF